MQTKGGRPDGRQNRGQVGKGCYLSPWRRQAVIRLDNDTMDEVVALAERDGVSLSHMLRILVEWGLEADQGAEM